MGVYEKTGTSYTLKDFDLYGLSRIGTYSVEEPLYASTAATNNAAQLRFEITDHLGSVRAVVGGARDITTQQPLIYALTDYHEFGMAMRGRSYTLENYRFGYQGSEKEVDIAGMYSTEFRQLDVRLGRWFSPDPVVHPWQSPYCSMDNNPIAITDIMGLEGDDGGPVNPCGQAGTVATNGGTYQNGGGIIGGESMSLPEVSIKAQSISSIATSGGGATGATSVITSSRDNTTFIMPNFEFIKPNIIHANISSLAGGVAVIPVGRNISRTRVDIGNVNSLWKNNHITMNTNELLISVSYGASLQKGSIRILADPWDDLPSMFEKATSYSRYYDIEGIAHFTFGQSVLNDETVMDYQLCGAGRSMGLPFSFGISQETRVVSYGHKPTMSDSVNTANENPTNPKSLSFKNRHPEYFNIK